MRYTTVGVLLGVWTSVMAAALLAAQETPADPVEALRRTLTFVPYPTDADVKYR
jgi:hypothetical protein